MCIRLERSIIARAQQQISDMYEQLTYLNLSFDSQTRRSRNNKKKFQRTQLYLAHSPFLVSAHCPLIGALLSPHKHLNRSSVSLTQLVLGMELQSLCVVQSLAFAVNEDEKKDFIYAERFYASVYSLNETK